MTEPKSPLDALLARIGRLLEGTAGSGVADQVQQVVADFLAAFRLVPKKEFDEHLAELHELQAQVGDLSRRIQALERQGD